MNSLNIAFIYDTQSDYGIEDKIKYADFCQAEEAELIIKSLKILGHTVKVIKGKKNLQKQISNLRVDLAFNKTEGFKSRNREGIVPALLEFYNIPYVGTDAYGFSASLNKYHTKLLANDIRVLTPDFCMISDESELPKLQSIQYPLIIKPNCEGSSMGVNLFHKRNDNGLKEKIIYLLQEFQQPVIVETYKLGTDISVPIIGTGSDAKSIGIVEFSNLDGTYPEIASTEFKYVEDYQTKILKCDKDLLDFINENSLKIYRALGCRDFGRVDFRLSNDIPYFLEINPLPTLCLHGAFDICAQNLSIDMKDIINSIIESSFKHK